MPKAYIAHLHCCLINATQEDLLADRAYLLEADGKPFALDVREIQRTINGLIRCVGISSNMLHRFEACPDITPEERETFEDEYYTSLATDWFKEHENWTAPGIFRSTANISRTHSYAVYALPEEDRPAVEASLTRWPHVFVNERGSSNLTMVKPRDCLVFPSGHTIRCPENAVFDAETANRFWGIPPKQTAA